MEESTKAATGSSEADKPNSQTSDAAKSDSHQTAAEKSSPPDAAKKAESPARTAPGDSPAQFEIVPGLKRQDFAGDAGRWIMRRLRHAQIQLKFGVTEHGKIEAFERAYRLLIEAEDLIADAEFETGDNTVRPTVAIRAWKNECLALQQNAAQTLYGRFPLIRAFHLRSTEETTSVETFSTPHEAERMAVRSALKEIVKSASTSPIEVAVALPGETYDAGDEEAAFSEMVRAEAQLLLAGVPNAKFVPNLWMSRDDAFPAWDAGDADFAPFCRQIIEFTPSGKQSRGVMIILVRALADAVDGDYWIQAQQRTFEGSKIDVAKDDPTKLEANSVRITEALTHDRSDLTLPTAAGIVLLFLLSIGIYYRWGKELPHEESSKVRKLLSPTFAFILGVALPPLMMIALERTLPAYDSSPLLTGWWPCAVGGMSLILPAGVFRIVAGSLSKKINGISNHGQWGLALIPVALGVTAAWIRPFAYAFDEQAMGTLGIFAVVSAILLYGFGRSIDIADRTPPAMIPLWILLTALFGCGAFLGSTLIIALSGVLGLSLLLFYHLLVQRRARREQAEREENSWCPTRPSTLEQLATLVNAPPYWTSQSDELLRKCVAAQPNDHCQWVAIVGPEGSGKTIGVQQLLIEQHQARETLKVLTGHCQEGGASFGPFREAFGDLGILTALSTSSTTGEMNSLVQRLAEQFIPFWDFFAGHEIEHDMPVVSQHEVFHVAASALQRAAEQQSLVLWIDDVQWLDSDSTALLKSLRESFPPGSEIPLLVLLTAREEGAVQTFEVGENIVHWTPLTREEQQQMLERGLGFDSRSARHLLEELGTMAEEAGGLAWLLEVVKALLAKSALESTSRGFVLQKHYLAGTRLPVPLELRGQLAETLKTIGSDRLLLECAALLGERFSADELAGVLGTDRLELLLRLQRLQHEHQLVREIPAHHDRYAFTSALVRKVVLEGLQQVASENREPELTKVAQELHHRIAEVLSQISPRSPAVLFRLARHAAQSGGQHLKSAIPLVREAQRVAREEKNMALAEHFQELLKQLCRRHDISVSDPDESLPVAEAAPPQEPVAVPAAKPSRQPPQTSEPTTKV